MSVLNYRSDEVSKNDFQVVGNTFPKDEFMRKMLVDEADVEMIHLTNILHQIENNFDAYDRLDLNNCYHDIANLKKHLKTLFTEVQSQTAL